MDLLKKLPGRTAPNQYGGHLLTIWRVEVDEAVFLDGVIQKS